MVPVRCRHNAFGLLNSSLRFLRQRATDPSPFRERCARADQVKGSRGGSLESLPHLSGFPGHQHLICKTLRVSASQEGASLTQTKSSWERWTERLVSVATGVFLFLLVPQIAKNAANLINGDLTALVAVAWVGYLTALLGNIMLLSYFLKRREDGGSLVQAVGAITNVVVLTQTYMAGTMPATVYYATAVLVVAAIAMSGLKRRGALDGPSGRAAWRLWDDFLGLVGVSSLSQAAASTFAGAHSQAPGVIGLCGAATVLALDRNGRMPPKFRGLWEGVPAWSATLLFAFQPVAQLVKNFAVPDSLAGLSQATVLLAMIGNGLMVPRALLTRDRVWLAGSAWASFTGWAQLLSLFVNRSPGGDRYLGAPGFAAATLLYLSYNSVVLRRDMGAKQLPMTPASITRLMRP